MLCLSSRSSIIARLKIHAFIGTARASRDCVMLSGEEHNARHEVRPKQNVVAASCINLEGSLSEAAPSKRNIIVKKAPNEGRVLDGFLLLDTCKVEFPEEVNEVVLVGLRINQILGEDLFFFNNLIRMDISDNEASLEPLQHLPALVELNFQCNALQQLSIAQGGFAKLEVLNLSHNCLTCRDFAQLSKMKRLRELYLGNNQIRSIPAEFGVFEQLEVLSLEYNSLHAPKCFSMLSLAPKLRILNVSHNQLSIAPESAVLTSGTRNNGFLRLHYLDLTYNKVLNEEQVYPLLHIETLRRLDLYGNPLTDAACHINDQTKLLYDPVPAMSQFVDRIAQAGRALTLLLAYPEFKSKRSHQSSYEHTDIYKMMPTDIPLSAPFHSRATHLLVQQGRSEKSNSPKKTSFVTESAKRSLKHEVDSFKDSFTFVTSAGNRSQIACPAILQPESIIAENYPSRPQPSELSELRNLRGENAAKALRYYLKHPLTAHNDDSLIPVHSQKPTLAHLHKRRTKKVHPPL